MDIEKKPNRIVMLPTNGAGDVDYAYIEYDLQNIEAVEREGFELIEGWEFKPFSLVPEQQSPRITEQDAPITLTTEHIEVFGRPNFACSSIARILVNKGFYAEIPQRSENEQAVAIHFMSSMLEKHGSNWKIEAEKVLNKLNNNPTTQEEK